MSTDLKELDASSTGDGEKPKRKAPKIKKAPKKQTKKERCDEVRGSLQSVYYLGKLNKPDRQQLQTKKKDDKYKPSWSHQ